MREASNRRTVTDTDSYAFSFITQSRQREDDRGNKSLKMTIAKGRSNCEAERDTIAQGFNELLKILKQAKNRTEVDAKAALYDILNDKSLPNEERWSKMRPFNDVLSEQEESDIRIRRTILIGLFSFWEISLKDMCEYYKINVTKDKGIKKKNKSNNEPLFNENDYLNAIFGDNRSENIGLISSQIKELRNYMTHGSAGEHRREIIDNLISAYPDFCVSKSNDGYYINSYDGLDSILKKIYDGLKSAEIATKKLNVQIKQP